MLIFAFSCAERKGHVGRSCRGCSVGASRHAEKGKLGLVRMNPHESPTYRSHLLTSSLPDVSRARRGREGTPLAQQDVGREGTPLHPPTPDPVDCNSHFLSESNPSWYNASQFLAHLLLRAPHAIHRCKALAYLLHVEPRVLSGCGRDGDVKTKHSCGSSSGSQSCPP